MADNRPISKEKKHCEMDAIGSPAPVQGDHALRRKVCITGAHSYIGESFETYAKDHYSAQFEIHTLSLRGSAWKNFDFSSYDAVFHVAGIAHADVGAVSEETKKQYYAVNTDLAIETAQKAKAAGVKQFVFMSSMIVYGESAGYGQKRQITKDTIPDPANFYGDSKWQADQGVRALADENFQVAVLRPPMIYGKGSKGNYPTLAKLAKKLPVFPKVENERSMLHIDNLCEFLCQLMLLGTGGIYFPQNGTYTNTSEMVKEIAKVSGKKIRESTFFTPAVVLGSKMPGKIGGLVNKAFGNMTYAQELSVYPGMEYQVVSLKESIQKTEGKDHQKRILMLVNHDVVIYNFRLELVERFLQEGFQVHISSPYGERIEDLKKLGAIYHEIQIDRHGMNPIAEKKILDAYHALYREVKPDIVLGYTIKPNIYGAMVAQKYGIPFVANITGLGTAVENGGAKQKVFVALYKLAFQNVQRVFFQNEENRQFFIDHKIAQGKHAMLPGSGVNLSRFVVSEYPVDDTVKFLFLSRIMKEKGIDQYLEAAEAVKKKYPNTEFHVCGFCEAEYKGKLNEFHENGTVIYHGMIREVAAFLRDIHCVVHPTYYPEGISNVLLEACASGRPIITTDRSGCREVVEDGYNGYMIPQKNSEKLIEALEKFLKLNYEGKKQMGLNARKKVEQQFDRQIVVEAYMREINKG
jgi:galacturonosyltransferase